MLMSKSQTQLHITNKTFLHACFLGAKKYEPENNLDSGVYSIILSINILLNVKKNISHTEYAAIMVNIKNCYDAFLGRYNFI